MAPFSTVAPSAAMGTSFHRETIFALARSLAKIPDVGWNDVERALFFHCPKIGEDNQVIRKYVYYSINNPWQIFMLTHSAITILKISFCSRTRNFTSKPLTLILLPYVSHSQVALSEKSRDAVIALGIFFLDSGCSARCADHVVPYLLGVERALSSAAILQQRNGDGAKKDKERAEGYKQLDFEKITSPSLSLRRECRTPRSFRSSSTRCCRTSLRDAPTTGTASSKLRLDIPRPHNQ